MRKQKKLDMPMLLSRKIRINQLLTANRTPRGITEGTVVDEERMTGQIREEVISDKMKNPSWTS